MTETKRLALVARVTDKIGSEGKDVKSTFSTEIYSAPYNRAMLDACFSHLHFCQSLPTPQRGLSAIADLLVRNTSKFQIGLRITSNPHFWARYMLCCLWRYQQLSSEYKLYLWKIMKHLWSEMCTKFWTLTSNLASNIDYNSAFCVIQLSAWEEPDRTVQNSMITI